MGWGFFPPKRKWSEPKFHKIIRYSSTKYRVKFEYASTGIISFLESQDCAFPFSSQCFCSGISIFYLSVHCFVRHSVQPTVFLGSSQVLACTRIETQRSLSSLKINWLNDRAPVSVFYCKIHSPQSSKGQHETLYHYLHYCVLFSYGLLYMANGEISTECINTIS